MASTRVPIVHGKDDELLASSACLTVFAYLTFLWSFMLARYDNELKSFHCGHPISSNDGAPSALIQCNEQLGRAVLCFRNISHVCEIPLRIPMNCPLNYNGTGVKRALGQKRTMRFSEKKKRWSFNKHLTNRNRPSDQPCQKSPKNHHTQSHERSSATERASARKQSPAKKGLHPIRIHTFIHHITTL